MRARLPPSYSGRVLSCLSVCQSLLKTRVGGKEGKKTTGTKPLGGHTQLRLTHAGPRSPQQTTGHGGTQAGMNITALVMIAVSSCAAAICLESDDMQRWHALMRARAIIPHGRQSGFTNERFVECPNKPWETRGRRRVTEAGTYLPAVSSFCIVRYGAVPEQGPPYGRTVTTPVRRR